MEILVLLAVVVIMGALLGGKSLGGTIRKGCGFFILLLILGIVALGILQYLSADSKSTQDEEKEVILTSDNSPNFVAKENCKTYPEPNIESVSSGNLEIGKDYFVKDSNKFNYFYEITFENGGKLFVRKECLERK